MPVILATQEAEIRKIMVWSQPREIVHEILSRKTQHKNTNGVSQVVEYLPSKCEALNSNPSTTPQ
jgi:hypothetical protein